MIATAPAVVARALLEDARDRLYRLADAEPALAPHLWPATVAITEVLTELHDGPGRCHEALLGASNVVAATWAMTASGEVRTKLADARGQLTKARELLTGEHGSKRGRRHLHLVAT